MPAYVNYDGDGSTNSWTVSFEYLAQSHVKLYIDGVEDTLRTFLTASSVAASSTPADGAVVTVKRETPRASLLYPLANSGSFRGTDINNQAKQALYIVEEAFDELDSTLAVDVTLDIWDAQNKIIYNVATPTDTSHAATKGYVDSLIPSIGSVQAYADAAAASAAAAAASAASMAFTKAGTPAVNQVCVWNSSTEFRGDPNLTWDGTTLAMAGTGDAVMEVDTNDYYLYDKTNDEHEWYVGSTFLAKITGTGSQFGSPTGGLKGAGTINAAAVYDDNSLLSCYVFDQVLDGKISDEKWDAKVPDLEVQKVIFDRNKRKIMHNYVETEERKHEPMRKFRAKVQGESYDPTQLEKYIAHWQEKRHLTSMPNEDKFEHSDMSSGEWIQRLIETVELQAVHDKQLLDRIKDLESALWVMRAKLKDKDDADPKS